MKLHCAPLSLFLCSIGVAQARVSSHNTVLDVEEDANWLLNTNQIDVNIANRRNDNCIRLSNKNVISAGSCSRATRWDLRLTRGSSSTYTIRENGTNKCLGISSNNRIEVSTCNTNNLKAENQRWRQDNGQISNTMENGRNCVEVDRTRVRIATCARNNSNQRFKFPGPPTRERNEQIKSVSDRSNCMRVQGSDIESGRCGSSTHWLFDANAGTFKYGGNSRTCLDATNGFDGAATIKKCDDSNSQAWEKLSNPDRIRSTFTNQCLKYNKATEKFNLRTCGEGEQFQFTYKTVDSHSEVKNVE